MSSFHGGDRIERWLNDNAKRFEGREDTLAVGFLEGATYPDGTSVPMVAAIMEFGGKMTIPARTVSVFQTIDKHGNVTRKGKFAKRAKANFESRHQVKAYTVTIPPRRYFRNMLDDVAPLLGPLVAKLLAKKDFDEKRILTAVGEFMKGRLQKSIITTNDPPLAPRTVARKGFDTPLIDTGHMQNSVDYEIKESTP